MLPAIKEAKGSVLAIFWAKRETYMRDCISATMSTTFDMGNASQLTIVSVKIFVINRRGVERVSGCNVLDQLV